VKDESVPIRDEGEDGRTTPLDLPRSRGDREQHSGRMRDLIEHSPIPPSELFHQAAMYLPWDAVFEIVALDRLYQRILTVPGKIFEFGCRWGRHLAIFASLREIYQPYNYQRTIVGFDTFSGFVSVAPEDGGFRMAHPGAFAVPVDYDRHLEDVLEEHERNSALRKARRFEIIRGDVAETVPQYLDTHPETIVALAYFDLDLYAPTKTCINLIRDRLVPGSILAFDEAAHPEWPGETVAIREALDLSELRLESFPECASPAFVVVGS
jgi:3-O-methyltransferase